MAYGRAGFAQGLSAGLGNLAALLRESRLTEEERRRRDEELKRRATEREEDIAREERYRTEDITREAEQRKAETQRLAEQAAGAELREAGGGIGQMPRVDMGTIRPTVLPEPSPERPRSPAGMRLEGLRRLPEPSNLQGPPPTAPQPQREVVRLPEPLVREAPVVRGQPLALSRPETETYEPVRLPAGGQGYRKRPEVLEAERRGQEEQVLTGKAEDLAAALRGTERFAGKEPTARPVAEAAVRGAPLGMMFEEPEAREVGRLTENQAIEKVLQLHPEYRRIDAVSGFVTGYTVPISQITRMAKDYREGRTPPEDLETTLPETPTDTTATAAPLSGSSLLGRLGETAGRGASAVLRAAGAQPGAALIPGRVAPSPTAEVPAVATEAPTAQAPDRPPPAMAQRARELKAQGVTDDEVRATLATEFPEWVYDQATGEYRPR